MAVIQGACPASPRSRRSCTSHLGGRSLWIGSPPRRTTSSPIVAGETICRRVRSASSTWISRRAPTTRPTPRAAMRAPPATGRLGVERGPWCGCPNRPTSPTRWRFARTGPNDDPGPGLRDGPGTVGRLGGPPRAHDARAGPGSASPPPRHRDPPLGRLRHDRGAVSGPWPRCSMRPPATAPISPRSTNKACPIGCGRSGTTRDRTWLAAEPLLIADGHHRYTTALQYREERHAADGPGPWDRVLTLIVDAAAEHLPVLPFHRMQTAGDAAGTNGPVLDGLEAALAACSDDDVIAAVASREARRDGVPVDPAGR